MRADAINWGNFATEMTGYPNAPSQYQIMDFPRLYHNGACGFSFADNHVELKRWEDPRTTPRFIGGPNGIVASPGNADVAWLQDHATRPK
jgi:prepilin-type processing-associated H-X9-DG protein